MQETRRPAGKGQRVQNPGLSRMGKWLILFSITTGTFMANVDASAVTVAIPTMAREFNANLSRLQWILTVYLLVITAVLPVFGRVSDIVGRKRVLNLGLLIFLLGSVLSGLAPGLNMLIAFRVVQGIGAAMFMATIMATAVTAFPAGEKGRVLGLIGSVVAAGTLAGPAVGGALIDLWGWRSIFFVNLPIGLLGAAGTFFFLPDDGPEQGMKGGIDFLGMVLFAGAAAAMLLGLDGVASGGLHSARVLGYLGLSILLFIIFVLQELRVSDPIVDVRLFGRRVFGLGNLSGFMFSMLMAFPAVFFPLYLHEVSGLTPGVLGALMTLQAAAMMIASPLGGRWADKRGPRPAAITGFMFIVLSMGAAALLNTSSSILMVAVVLLLMGVGFGLFLSPNNSAIISDVPPKLLGVANGIIATQRNMGRAVGVAASVLVYALVSGTTRTQNVPPAQFMTGFSSVFLVGVILALAATIATALMFQQGSEKS